MNKKKIAYDIILASAIYNINGEFVSISDLNKYINIIKRVFKKNGYIVCSDISIENFCHKYYYLFSYDEDGIYKFVDNEMIKVYLLMQIDGEIKELLEKSFVIYNDIGFDFKKIKLKV